MNSVLPHITLDTGKSPQHSIIWLHGLGADGGDFVPVAEEMSLPVAVRYIFPHAPKQPVTINGGFVMRAWYDISYGDLEGKSRQADEKGVRASRAEIEKLIAREVARGIRANKIVIAGFSQGGAIALHTGLRHAAPLAGIMALSTYLPAPHTLPAEAAAANRDIALFYAHGSDDQVIPIAMAETSRQTLSAAGYAVDWHEYPMQHSVCLEEIRDISAWLQTVLR